VSNLSPVGGGRGGVSYRTVRTQPVVFSTVDPHALFHANNVLWKTLDGGIHWKQISPDLTRKEWTPPQMAPFMRVFMIDTGRFDALTAYAAVNTLRLDDMRPHIYRTHDGGKTWTEIVTGLPDGVAVSVVREDPKKKALLFAGSGTQVYVSFDDGDHWQSLRLNMAPSSVRDLIIKDDDAVAATHGRGFWILDDITPLRQIDTKTADAEAVLFQPTAAWRVRWSTNSDTPLPAVFRANWLGWCALA